jgi:hypothetical protein
MLRLNSARLLCPNQLLKTIRCLSIIMLLVDQSLKLSCCLFGIDVLEQELLLLFHKKVKLLS